MLTISHSVKEKYPGLLFGIMVMSQVVNPESHEKLNAAKRQLEEELRLKYAGMDRRSLRNKEVLHAYHEFYRKFRKSYFVQHQLESIVLEGKSIPDVAALVEAMFMAELKNQLLTAGLDYALIKGDVHVELSNGERDFFVLGGRQATPPVNDVLFADRDELLGSIICGPSHKQQITPETTQVMFAIYGVCGITEDQMRVHFDDIARYVSIITPSATVDLIEIR